MTERIPLGHLECNLSLAGRNSPGHQSLAFQGPCCVFFGTTPNPLGVLEYQLPKDPEGLVKNNQKIEGFGGPTPKKIGGLRSSRLSADLQSSGHPQILGVRTPKFGSWMTKTLFVNSCIGWRIEI
jgi:hypothetical protein